jgi:hypothetical protein
MSHAADSLCETNISQHLISSKVSQSQNWTPITPPRGSNLHAGTQPDELVAVDEKLNLAGEEVEKQTPEPSHWLLGPKAMQAGSLHCDLWRGYAVDLASHDHIAIYPVTGWWKSHLGQKRMTDKARYALTISITAEGQDVDLYSEIAAELAAYVAAQEVGIEAAP